MAKLGDKLAVKMSDKNIAETERKMVTKQRKQRVNSAVIWEGLSPYDNGPIMAVITNMDGSSQNDKTGRMAQVSIIRSDMHPWEAIKTDADVSICGGCPLRYTWNETTRKFERICYVNVVYGIAAKWRKESSTGYVRMTPEEAGDLCAANGVGIRGGDYGDPGMIPYEIWHALFSRAPFHTAYTHQWMEPFFDVRLFQYVMASVDSTNTVEKLQAIHGPDVRYYRLADDYENVASNEAICPSKKNGERVRTCAECKLCAGASRPAKSIVIIEDE